jgi:hypothetical protein
MTQEKRTARGPRLRVIAVNCSIAAAGTAVIAACGTTPAPGTAGSGSGGGPSKASLQITVETGAGHATKHWTLRCDPAGGTHPNPAAACRALTALKDPFAPPKAGQSCPNVMANGKAIVFKGVWHGQKVSRTIADGGCTITVWHRLNQALN